MKLHRKSSVFDHFGARLGEIVELRITLIGSFAE